MPPSVTGCAWASAPGLPVHVADLALIRQVTGLGVVREAIGVFARPAERPVAALLAHARRVLVA